MEMDHRVAMTVRQDHSKAVEEPVVLLVEAAAASEVLEAVLDLEELEEEINSCFN
jgi:hypothetical protein